MSQTFRQAVLGMTCAAALVLSAVPSIAAITGQDELEKIVTNELTGLGIKTDHVKQLTLAQIAELATITQSADSDATRKAAAEKVIDSAIKPQMMMMGNAGAVQLEKELKDNLTSVGIVLPPREKLTFAQVMELTTIFDAADTATADKKAAAEKVLGMN
jgi:5-methylthioribose kinase